MPAPSQTDGAVGHRPATDATAELYALLAMSKLATFGRLAEDATVAPDIAQRVTLSSLAARELATLDTVTARIAELGADPPEAIGSFRAVLADFDLRTVPSTWGERMLKTHLGHGVMADLIGVAAATLPEADRRLVEETLDTRLGTDETVLDLIQEAVSDQRSAARLALWGRRLVGEAMTCIQQLLAQHPAVAGLVSAGLGEDDRGILATLTAAHTLRMNRLGLTA